MMCGQATDEIFCMTMDRKLEQRLALLKILLRTRYARQSSVRYRWYRVHLAQVRVCTNITANDGIIRDIYISMLPFLVSEENEFLIARF